MKPLKLTLTGFRGIQAGMGLETFTLDLQQYAGAQLVAIVAPNGRGKTTVLDNLQPYRLMPSKIRGANYSPEAFSYFDHLVSPGKASKELIWEHNGTTYRTLIEWNITAKTQSAAAYLQRRNAAGEWEPVTLPDGTSSDGKAKTYDHCVEGILGSPRLYFTAAFSAQGRSQLSSYAQGDIKGLMAEVLDLNKIEDLGEKATAVTKALRSKLGDHRQALQELDGIQRQAGELRADIDSNTRLLTSEALPAIDRAEQSVTRERVAVDDIKRGQQDAEQIRLRRKAITDQIDEQAAAYRAAVATIDADISKADASHQQALQRFDGEQGRLSTATQRAESRKADALALLGQRDAIQQAQDALPALQGALADAETALQHAQEQVSEGKQGRAALGQLEAHIASLVDAGRRVRKQEEELLGRCALTKEVPCQGTDLQGRCKLLSEAVEAEQQLPTVRADLEARTAEHKEAVERKQALAVKVQELPTLEAQLADATARLQQARTMVSDAEKLAAKAGALAAAEAALADAEDSIRAGNEQLAELQDQRMAAEQIHKERLDELNTRKTQAKAKHEDDTQRLHQELARIPVPDDDSALQSAEQRLEAAIAAEQTARNTADRLRGAIATDQGRLSALDERLAAAAALQAAVNHLETELAHWTTLQKALGRDGILALSIDDAGPTLAGLANDLLLSCYGPRFSVRIDTQETVKSTGAQKETFDVVVFDSESDSSKSVSEMSGGERIWINEALTRAIALYQAQQSGQTFQTLFSDESDGALDPEKKHQFVQMKRRVLELGGYNHEFFISHSPDVWPLADAILNLGEAA